MKKVMFTLIGTALFCLQANAQMKPDKRYEPAYTYDTYEDMDMVKCGKGWATRPIKVKGGGKAPDIVKLTKAFNDVWNVYVVSTILKQAKNPKFTSQKYPEYDSEDIVDRPNGYMCVDSGGTDSDYMESCVWRCDNGHRLFAILMGGPTDPEIELVCFYDYDPATETMTPVVSPVDTFKPKYEFYSYDLPRKGKDFMITEYDVAAGEAVSHVYTWDGQKHVYGYDKKEKMK